MVALGFAGQALYVNRKAVVVIDHAVMLSRNRPMRLRYGVDLQAEQHASRMRSQSIVARGVMPVEEAAIRSLREA